jgi:hypothetical protein
MLGFEHEAQGTNIGRFWDMGMSENVQIKKLIQMLSFA